MQVPSNRSRKTLLPIIDQHCLPGTIFCSDGWKAYHKLKEHLQLEDVDHFPVNHSENFVDPESGAHTQTIEGVWKHCKDFLPSFVPQNVPWNFLLVSLLQTMEIRHVPSFPQVCC